MRIIYPPENHSTDSETIFFIGSAQEYCFINGRGIELSEEGNFCPIFKLKPGTNIFVSDVDDLAHQKFVIERTEKQAVKESTFRDYVGNDVAKKFSRICLDAGHGGLKNGATSPKGIFEKDMNLFLVGIIAEELVKNGFEVILTRDEDVDLELEKRVKISEQNECDLFLSIHHNAVPDDENPLDFKGISAHYYYDHSKELAVAMSKALAEGLGMEDRSAIQQDLYLTRENSHCQAVLLECGFLIHPEESELICSKEHQEKLASKLVDFLLSYK